MNSCILGENPVSWDPALRSRGRRGLGVQNLGPGGRSWGYGSLGPEDRRKLTAPMPLSLFLLTCVHSISLCRGRIPGRWRPAARTQLVVAEQMVELSRGQCGVVGS